MRIVWTNPDPDMDTPVLQVNDDYLTNEFDYDSNKEFDEDIKIKRLIFRPRRSRVFTNPDPDINTPIPPVNDD